MPFYPGESTAVPIGQEDPRDGMAFLERIESFACSGNRTPDRPDRLRRHGPTGLYNM